MAVAAPAMKPRPPDRPLRPVAERRPRSTAMPAPVDGGPRSSPTATSGLALRRHLPTSRTAPRRGLRFDADRAGRAIRFFGFLPSRRGRVRGPPVHPRPGQASSSARSSAGTRAPRRLGPPLPPRLRRDGQGQRQDARWPPGSASTACSLTSEQRRPRSTRAAVTRDQAGDPVAATPSGWSSVARRCASAARGLRAQHRPPGAVGRASSGRSAPKAAPPRQARPRRRSSTRSHAHPSSMSSTRCGPARRVAATRSSCGSRTAATTATRSAGQHHDYSNVVLEASSTTTPGSPTCVALTSVRAPAARRAGRRLPRCDLDRRGRLAEGQPATSMSRSPASTCASRSPRRSGKPAPRDIVKRLCFCVWTEGAARWLPLAGLDAMADAPADPLRRPRPLPASTSPRRPTSPRSSWSPRGTSATSEGHAGRCYRPARVFWPPEAGCAAASERDHVPYDVVGPRGLDHPHARATD